MSRFTRAVTIASALALGGFSSHAQPPWIKDITQPQRFGKRLRSQVRTRVSTTCFQTMPLTRAPRGPKVLTAKKAQSSESFSCLSYWAVSPAVAGISVLVKSLRTPQSLAVPREVEMDMPGVSWEGPGLPRRMWEAESWAEFTSHSSKGQGGACGHIHPNVPALCSHGVSFFVSTAP